MSPFVAQQNVWSTGLFLRKTSRYLSHMRSQKKLTDWGYSELVSTGFHLIIKNLNGITAESPMVGTAIIMPLCPKTSEMAKEQERKVELPGIEPKAIGLPCQCSATAPTSNHPSFAISEVFKHNGMIQRSLIRPGLIGLWTKNNWSPNHRTLSCD